MRSTLLEMVQSILSAMDSDEVNSISDTVESNQVALLIKYCYYDIATDLGLPEHETLFELNASGDIDKPVLMSLPNNVVNMFSVKYDNRQAGDTYSDHREVQYLPFDEFYQRQLNLRSELADVEEMALTLHGETFPFMYWNNKAPQYYTTLEENYVVFDSYDVSIENTLQKSKTLCTGNLYPDFELTDNFYPVLDPSQFSYLYNKAKTRAFNELKQQQNLEAAAEARRQKVIVQKRKDRTPDVAAIMKTPRYGRK